MKKKILVIIPCIALAVFLFSCDSKDKHKEHDDMNNHADAKTAQYTCPMHPEVISDKEGACPKCGMDLVLKEKSASDSTKHE